MNTQHTIERVSDELAIRAVLDEYCLRLEINDFEEWLDLFTDDSVYEVFRRELKGRDEIRAMLSQAPHGIHIGGAARIAIEGNRAETTQNYVFIGNDPAHNNQGWYFRTLVRDGATWKIAHTRVKLSK